MGAITLAQAERIIDAVIGRGAALELRPLSVIVLAPFPPPLAKEGRG